MIKQLNVTLSGSAQVLTGGISGTYNDPPIKQIGIQADSANTHVVRVGDSSLTDSLFLTEIPVPPSSIPYGPLIIDFPKDSVVRLSELYVKGTDTEKIHGWVVV